MIRIMKFFISHAKEDNSIVREIIKIFDKNNIPYWVDFQQLKIGKKAMQEINKGLESSTHFLLIWTKNAKKSQWVDAEKSAAIEADKHIKISLKADRTRLGVPFSQFVYSSINSKNLESTIEGIIKEDNRFTTQIKKFKKLFVMTMKIFP